jgi:hypothetical protein
MNEQKSEKKVVGRTVAIALGIICIVLAVGLVGAIADYRSIIGNKDNTISTQGSQISNLQTWLSGNITTNTNYVNSHSYTNEQYQDLQNQNTNLQNEINDLNNITNLKKSMIWDVGTINATFWNDTEPVFYAGYVSVWIQISTSNSTTVRATWSSYGVNYDQTVIVGTSGRLVFPVLPSTVSITVEHTSLFTVIITYYY